MTHFFKQLIGIGLLISSLSVRAQQADSAQYYFKKGQENQSAKLYALAEGSFQKAIQFDAKFIEAYRQQGYVQLAMRKTDGAKISFSKVLELQPGDQQAIQELADLYFSYHQYEKAIELSQQCNRCENSAKIQGMSYAHLEDYAQAEKYLLQAVLANPNDAFINYSIGRNYTDMEEYKKAIPYYKKALELDTQKPAWYYELGLVHYTLNEYKLALQSFKMAEQTGYPQSSDFKENLGYTSLYCGEYENGETILLTIWKKKPGNKDILRDLSEILYKQQQFDRSLVYCQQLLELDANDGKALYQAGLCFQKKGQKDRGQQMCDKAIVMDPSLESLRRKKEMSGM